MIKKIINYAIFVILASVFAIRQENQDIWEKFNKITLFYQISS